MRTLDVLCPKHCCDGLYCRSRSCRSILCQGTQRCWWGGLEVRVKATHPGLGLGWGWCWLVALSSLMTFVSKTGIYPLKHTAWPAPVLSVPTESLLGKAEVVERDPSSAGPLSSTGTLPGGLGGKRCASLPREEIQPGTPSLGGLLVGYYNKLTLFVHLWILTKFCICSSQLQKLLRV